MPNKSLQLTAVPLRSTATTELRRYTLGEPYKMTDRRVDGFFYGLFMDESVLGKSQVTATNPRRAYVDDYALRIGRRATLVQACGARAYGMVFSLTHHELEKLYGAPGLEEYRPEAFLVHKLDGESLPALCYNLREGPRSGEANPEYAASLRNALRKLDFPPEYVSSVS